MALKKLSKFVFFDFEEFARKKKFLSIGQSPWKDFSTGNISGTKIEVVIAQDRTDYGEVPEGEVVSNIYEKLTIKVPKQIEVPLNVEVRPINAIGSVYGDYRNQLSITAEDIEVVSK